MIAAHAVDRGVAQLKASMQPHVLDTGELHLQIQTGLSGQRCVWENVYILHK